MPYLITLDPVSLNGDFSQEFIFTDQYGELIDFSGASLQMTVRDSHCGHYGRIASTDNGEVTVPGIGSVLVQSLISGSNWFCAIRPGIHRGSLTFMRGGAQIELAILTIPVTEGYR